MVAEICAVGETFGIEVGVPPNGISEKLTLKTPVFAFTNEPIKLTGTTEGINQQVLIMLEKGVWGIDWFAKDETLKSLTSDGEGNFETEITFDAIGMPKVYAAQKKEWWGIDILAKDIKSQTHSIIVVDMWILATIGVLLVYVLYQRGFFKKIVKKRRKK